MALAVFVRLFAGSQTSPTTLQFRRWQFSLPPAPRRYARGTIVEGGVGPPRPPLRATAMKQDHQTFLPQPTVSTAQKISDLSRRREQSQQDGLFDESQFDSRRSTSSIAEPEIDNFPTHRLTTRAKTDVGDKPIASAHNRAPALAKIDPIHGESPQKLCLSLPGLGLVSRVRLKKTPLVSTIS